MVSLDTLDPVRLQALTRRNTHARVLEGIGTAAQVGLTALKFDTVVMRGCNDDELVALLEYGKRVGAEVRFIEYMDVGGATQWSQDAVFPHTAMLDVLRQHYGSIEQVIEVSLAPAQRFILPDGTIFGFLASTTIPFTLSFQKVPYGA
jgi:cyclic pyranopterin phosphate synthase